MAINCCSSGVYCFEEDRVDTVVHSGVDPELDCLCWCSLSGCLLLALVLDWGFGMESLEQDSVLCKSEWEPDSLVSSTTIRSGSATPTLPPSWLSVPFEDWFSSGEEEGFSKAVTPALVVTVTSLLANCLNLSRAAPFHWFPIRIRPPHKTNCWTQTRTRTT